MKTRTAQTLTDAQMREAFEWSVEERNRINGLYCLAINAKFLGADVAKRGRAGMAVVYNAMIASRGAK